MQLQRWLLVVRKIAPFKENFDDTDEPGQNDDESDDDDDDEDEDDDEEEDEDDGDEDDEEDDQWAWSRRTLIATARATSIMACSTRPRISTAVVSKRDSRAPA